MRRVLVALMVVLACATAYAGPKKKQTAQILSGVGAGASGAVVIAGFMTAPAGDRFNAPVMYTGLGLLAITPSLGEFYAGQYLTWGMGIRAVAVGLAVVGLQRTQVVRCDNATSSSQTCDALTGSGYAIIGIAAIAYVGGAALDCEDAPEAADRYNQTHYMIAPTVMTTQNGAAPGLYFSATY